MEKFDTYQLSLFNEYIEQKDQLFKDIKENIDDDEKIFLYCILPFLKMKEISIAIIGSRGCGKSSFIKRLKGDDFCPVYQATQGITTYVIERNHFKINIVDYSGSEILEYMNSCIQQKIDGVIVMFSSKSKFSYHFGFKWYKYIIEKSGKIPTVIIKNKVDSYKEYKKTNQSSWNISCKNLCGVNKSFNSLLEQF